MRQFYAVFLMMLASVGPTLAEEQGPVGIAFVEAPEQGGGVCTGRDPETAFTCAREKCVSESGAAEEDCLSRTWCFPAGWSVDVFVQHEEGPHWHEVLCGLDSRETAMAVAADLCDKGRRPYLMECAAAQLYDPDGNTVEVTP